MNWSEIQKAIERIIEMDRQNNSVKARIGLPNVAIYNIPKQNVVRVDIKTK